MILKRKDRRNWPNNLEVEELETITPGCAFMGGHPRCLPIIID